MNFSSLKKKCIVSLRQGFGYARETFRFLRQLCKFAAHGFKPIEVIFPSGNAPLTQAEFDHCCTLIDYYAEEGKQIIPYCLEHKRDVEIYDRGNVWKHNLIAHNTRMLLAKHYNNVNRMRLIGWHFSSYRLLDLSPALSGTKFNGWYKKFYEGKIEELPEDMDSIIKATINPSWRIGLLTPRLGTIIDRMDNSYLHSQPLRFGEIAGRYRDFMVNGDSERYWATVTVLHRTGILKQLEHIIATRGFCRVMEIGAGYGGLAYQLKKTYGEKLQFIAVDLVESLIFSSCYLTTLLPGGALYYRDEKTILPEAGLVFVPSFRSPEFFDTIGTVDLCINTISMNEMAPAQVEYYGDKISKVLATDGVFFECNWTTSVSPERIHIKPLLAAYFKHRLSLYKTEVSGDGDLDLWSNLPLGDIEAACKEQYPGPSSLEMGWAQLKSVCRSYT